MSYSAEIISSSTRNATILFGLPVPHRGPWFRWALPVAAAMLFAGLGLAALADQRISTGAPLASAGPEKKEVKARKLPPAHLKPKWNDEADLLRDPPASAIRSGKALNDLLRAINRSGKPLNTRPNVPLAEKTLAKINLAGAGFKGQIDMLKRGGKLKWPTALQAAAFEEARKRFTSKFELAGKQLKDGKPIEPATIRELRPALKALNKQVSDDSEKWSPAEYIEARKFLNGLEQAVRALEDPNVAKAFNGDWAAKGRTAAELVAHVNKKGLQFAAVTPGEEAAYTDLYRALRAFYVGGPPRKEEKKKSP